MSSVPATRVRCPVKLPPHSVGNIASASTYCFAMSQYGWMRDCSTYEYAGYGPPWQQNLEKPSIFPLSQETCDDSQLCPKSTYSKVIGLSATEMSPGGQFEVVPGLALVSGIAQPDGGASAPG